MYTSQYHSENKLDYVLRKICILKKVAMTYLKTVYTYSSVEIEINQKGSSVSMPENMVRIRNMYLSNKSQNITEVTDVG